MPSGGVREGAGRKQIKKSYSDKFKSNVWKALKKMAKERGSSVFDEFAKRIFDRDINPFVFSSLWKSLCEVMAAKETKSTIETHDYGPTIGLPPMKEKPKDESFWTPVPKGN